MTPPFLTEKVRELIQKSRIVSFDSWANTYPESAIALFQVADDNRLYLTDRDVTALKTLVPEANDRLTTASFLRDRASDIVDEARTQVLQTFPDILEPGGGLYPAERAEACWRDFWQFLRCITYGIAGGRTDYTSADGLRHMNMLYRELHVPLDAMVVGLKGLKTASLKRLNSGDRMAPYFDRLIEQLEQFD